MAELNTRLSRGEDGDDDEYNPMIIEDRVKYPGELVRLNDIPLANRDPNNFLVPQSLVLQS